MSLYICTTGNVNAIVLAECLSNHKDDDVGFDIGEVHTMRMETLNGEVVMPPEGESMEGYLVNWSTFDPQIGNEFFRYLILYIPLEISLTNVFSELETL